MLSNKNKIVFWFVSSNVHLWKSCYAFLWIHSAPFTSPPDSRWLRNWPVYIAERNIPPVAKNNSVTFAFSLRTAAKSWITTISKVYQRSGWSLFNSGVGNLLLPGGWIRPAKQNHQARSPLANCSNCMGCLVALYFSNLSSLQLLALNTYEELLIRNHVVL